MSQPLRNPRHERFAQLLAEGLPASRAFVEAGYAPNDGNAIRLKGNEKVQARLAELQAQAAAKTEVTLETILADLVDAAAVAKSKGQGQALVSAAMAKAKLLGLDIQRIEVGNPGDFDNLNSTREIADKVLERLIEGFAPIDEKDRQGLVEMYERHLAETAEYIAAIKARPIIANRVNPRDLSTPWQQHRPFTPTSPLRIGYKPNGNRPA